jgi:transcriptional regulator with XRE-family HTH domain
MDFSDAFADVIERRRLAHRLSKEALEQRAGLHQTYVGLIERNLRNPTLDSAHALVAGPSCQVEVLGKPIWRAVVMVAGSRCGDFCPFPIRVGTRLEGRHGRP